MIGLHNFKGIKNEVNSKYKELVSDTFIFAIGNFTTKFIFLFLMPIYTLVLTKEEYGLADLLTNALSLILPICTICISESVFRFILEKDIEVSKVLNVGLKVIVLSSVVVVAICLILYLVYGELYWILFSVLYVSESSKNLFANFVRGIKQIKVFAISGIINAFVLLILSFVLIKEIEMKVNGYLIAFIGANICSILYLVVRAKLYRHVFIKTLVNNELAYRMVKYSLPLIPNLLFWWLNNVSSRYIIVSYCGLGIAGLFSAASKLPSIVNTVASVFQQSWQLSSVKEYNQNKKSDFFSQVLQVFSIVIFSFSSLGLILLPYLSKFILQSDFYQAWIYSPLLVISAVIGCFSVFFGTFYLVVMRNVMNMVSTMIGAIVNLILCFVLIPRYDVWGAIIANVVSYIVIVGIRMYDTRRFFKVKINWYHYLLSFGLLFLQAIYLSTGSVGKNKAMVVFVLVLIVQVIYTYVSFTSKKVKQ